jgi:hypothetical protein
MKTLGGQAAIEYMVTYGWALLIVAIAFAMLLAYVTLPSRATPNECSFTTSTVTCVDFVLGSSSGRTTTMAINMTNSQQYPILNPELVVEVNGKNSSLTTCSPSYVAPQKEIYCDVTLPINTSQGTLLSGSLYLNITNCALSANYISSGLQTDCTGAASQTITGHYVGHTEVPFTIGSGTLYISTYHPGIPDTAGDVYKINFQAPNTISIVNTISTNDYFNQLVASSDGKYIYGIGILSGSQTLYTMSTQSGTVTNTLTLPGATYIADSLAIDPTNSYLYVCGENGDIWKVSASTHTVVSTLIGLGGFVPSCAISNSGADLYVADIPSGSSPPTSFYTVATSTGLVTNTMTGLPGSCDYVIVAPTPNGTYAYTGCSSGMKIDLSNDVVIDTGVTISGYAPTGTVFTSDSKYMYTAGGTAYDKMFVSNDLVTNTVSGFNYVYGAALIANGGYIALGDTGASQLYIYDTTTGKEAANMIIPDGNTIAAVVET